MPKAEMIIKDLITRIEKEGSSKRYLLVNCLHENELDLVKLISDRIREESKGQLLNISYMSIGELISKLSLVISDDLLIDVMDKFNLSYNIARMYLSNVSKYQYLGLDNDKVMNEIIKYLNTRSSNLSDKYINLFLEDKEIIIIGRYLDEYEKKMLEGIKYEEINVISDHLEKSYSLLEFKTKREEVGYAMEAICDLINTNVSPSNIYICASDEDSLLEVKRISKMFGLIVNVKSDIRLDSISYARYIMNALINGDEIQAEEMSDKEYDIYKRVLNIYNKYSIYKAHPSFKDFISAKLKEASVNAKVYKNGINVIDINQNLYFFEGANKKEVFVLGLNQGVIPHLIKDEDYISDACKSRGKIYTSYMLNEINANIVKSVLNTDNNFHLSYARKRLSKTFIPSSLLSSVNIKKKEASFQISFFSDEYNLETYAYKFDEFYKYHSKDDALCILDNTYKDLNNYQTYDNSFSGIDKDEVLKLKNNTIDLSYSSMETYSECAFKYYIKNILKLEERSDNFSTFIGNVYHDVLEHVYKNNFEYDLDSMFEDAINNNHSKYKMNKTEEVLLYNLKDRLALLLDVLKEQSSFINYKDALFEKGVSIEKVEKIRDKDVKLVFKGFIDKLLYKKDPNSGRVYSVIIDYKTSEAISFDIDLAKKGLGLQLLIYAYLGRHIESFKDVIISGFYIQTVLDKTVYDHKDISKKYDQYKLKGYTNTDALLKDETVDMCFDKNYVSSSIIKNLKLSKDGSWYRYAQVLNNQEIEDLVELVSDTIEKTFKDIIDAKFDINPKKNGKINLSCNYCKFKDLCFVRQKDFVQLSDSLKEDGEEDA